MRDFTISLSTTGSQITGRLRKWLRGGEDVRSLAHSLARLLLGELPLLPEWQAVTRGGGNWAPAFDWVTPAASLEIRRKGRADGATDVADLIMSALSFALGTLVLFISWCLWLLRVHFVFIRVARAAAESMNIIESAPASRRWNDILGAGLFTCARACLRHAAGPLTAQQLH